MFVYLLYIHSSSSKFSILVQDTMHAYSHTFTGAKGHFCVDSTPTGMFWEEIREHRGNPD